MMIFCFKYKMNEIVNKLLLVGDKFMPGMEKHSLTYSACCPFTKNKKRIEEFMQTENTEYIYKNDLDKACFQHGMTYGKLTIWIKQHNQIRF